MALKLIANYSKRLGLPGYSSHQFSISVESELNNTDDVQAEAGRLYTTLQRSVDQEIQNTGFVPGEGYGQQSPKKEEWPVLQRNTVPQANGTSNGSNGNSAWKCSDKQRDLKLKLMEDNPLQKGDLQSLSLEMFGSSEVSGLNKLQASGLIDRLIEQYGGKARRGTTPVRFNGRSGK